MKERDGTAGGSDQIEGVEECLKINGRGAILRKFSVGFTVEVVRNTL